MTLVQLIADLRKTARRIRRRGHLVGLQQLQAWQRRLARLKARFAAFTGREWRRQAFVLAGAAALALGLSRGAEAGIRFNQVDANLTLLDSTNSAAYYTQAAFADLDGDGDLDAVGVNDNGYILYWRNDGSKTKPHFVEKTGTAESPFNYFYLGSYNYKGVTLGDVDGDGDFDLLIGVNTNLRFFKNIGTNTSPEFQQQYGIDNPFAYVYNYYGSKPVFADLDSDGDLDVIIAYYDTLGFVKNTGTKTAPVFVTQFGSDDPFNGLSQSTYIDYAWAAVGDLDADGDVDVLVGGYGSYYLDLWKNTGSATAPAFTNEGSLPVHNYYWMPSLADYDGDGDLDLFSGYKEGGVQNFENKGGKFGPKFSQPFPYYNIYDSITRADVDSDGDIDVLQEGYLWRNNGGVYQFEYSYFFQYYASSKAATFADLDGDGDNDFVSVSGSAIRYYRKDGAAGSIQFTELTGASNPFNGIAISTFRNNKEGRLIDMDGDGDLDFVIASYDANSSGLQFVRNDGTPTAPVFSLQTGASNPFNGIVVPHYSRPLLDDLDHDGDVDFLSVGYYTGQEQLYLNVGTAAAPDLQPEPFSFNRTSQGSPIILDFDHDGDPDIVTWDWDTYVFHLLRNDSERFTKVDALALEKNKPLLGPVPAVSGQDLCIYMPASANTMDIDLYNLAGEKVQNGLSSVSAGVGCFKATLVPGLYVAKITVDGKVTTQKIIITK